jgi:hypothetical protein
VEIIGLALATSTRCTVVVMGLTYCKQPLGWNPELRHPFSLTAASDGKSPKLVSTPNPKAAAIKIPINDFVERSANILCLYLLKSDLL